MGDPNIVKQLLAHTMAPTFLGLESEISPFCSSNCTRHISSSLRVPLEALLTRLVVKCRHHSFFGGGTHSIPTLLTK